MTNKKDELITQHIREYESRLKHIDELYDRAQQATENLDDDNKIRRELKSYEEQKSQLASEVEKIETMPLENWREETARKAGPMAIWDILAQKLEDFVERHE